MEEELLLQLLSNPEVLETLKEIAPQALETGERVVVSGIETSGRVIECAIKDGKIIEHTAVTVQEGIKSTENVAVSIISEGGDCFKCLVKDGHVVQESGKTLRYATKTAGEVVKELIDEQAGIINNALETIGNVSTEAIKGRVAVITVREREITERDRIDAEVKKTEILIEGKKYESLIDAAKDCPELFSIQAKKEVAMAMIEKEREIDKYKGVSVLLNGIGSQLERLTFLGQIRKMMNDFCDRIPVLSKNKELNDVLIKAYQAQEMMSQLSDPVVDSMKRMLSTAVESKNPIAIDIMVESIVKEWDSHLLPLKQV